MGLLSPSWELLRAPGGLGGSCPGSYNFLVILVCGWEERKAAVGRGARSVKNKQASVPVIALPADLLRAPTFLVEFIKHGRERIEQTIKASGSRLCS